jgi:hypothetical protein
MSERPSIPDDCSIAFKEWASVCSALGSGRQSLILRKGGVSEGPGGFVPEHRAFWLYPTFVHQAEQGLRSATRAGLVESPGEVAIEALAVVDWVDRVESVEQLASLFEYHDWTEATVLGRFHYRTPGLWAMVTRVYRLAEPWRIASTPTHLGCKTWVPLENPPPTSGLSPVLGDAESTRRLSSIRGVLQGSG